MTRAPASAPTLARALSRPFWLVIGIACLVLGLLGSVLPLLPTTPFVLAAAFAFARSSPRLQAWLYRHPRLGPLITDWKDHGAIAPRAKKMAVAAMAAALLFSILGGVPLWLLLVQALVLGAVATFVLTRPDGPRAGRSSTRARAE
ncbi:MAG: YbaN family protein [Geminicoccaceae bacterium]|nr:YbaN family protein [Geminicoccaceae bacterium]